MHTKIKEVADVVTSMLNTPTYSGSVCNKKAYIIKKAGDETSSKPIMLALTLGMNANN